MTDRRAPTLGLRRGVPTVLHRVSWTLARWRDHMHRYFAPRMFGANYRRHRRRCRVCNPAGFRRPLPINGHEYRRRARNRRRRR